MRQGVKNKEACNNHGLEIHAIPALACAIFFGASSLYRNRDRTMPSKYSECERLTNAIVRSAKEMGLISSVDKSRRSASHYIYIAGDASIKPDEDDEDSRTLKVRVSDHSDRYPNSDIYQFTGDTAADVIAGIAAAFHKEVPPQFTEAGFAKKSANACNSAHSRRVNADNVEAEMVEYIVKVMSTSRLKGPVAVGKAIDVAFPGIPRAQRQRMCNHISSRLKKGLVCAA